MCKGYWREDPVEHADVEFKLESHGLDNFEYQEHFSTKEHKNFILNDPVKGDAFS
jgi:hypothetical protein